MQLVDALAAGLLVQAVDVLGHDGAELAGLFERGELFVRLVRLIVQREHLFTVKFEEIFRVLIEKRVAQDRLGRIVEFLVIQAVRAAEVRDAGLGRHARAAEKHDVVTFGNPGF